MPRARCHGRGVFLFRGLTSRRAAVVAQRTRMVEDIIELLHLQDCADVLVGSEMIKGISGGEKKRTAIGVELVTRPSILFLDEPTSGLDSWAAYSVIQNLKALSAKGCTILTTIHQPSSEVFHLFDQVSPGSVFLLCLWGFLTRRASTVSAARRRPHAL